MDNKKIDLSITGVKYIETYIENMLNELNDLDIIGSTEDLVSNNGMYSRYNLAIDLNNLGYNDTEFKIIDVDGSSRVELIYSRCINSFRIIDGSIGELERHINKKSL